MRMRILWERNKIQSNIFLFRVIWEIKSSQLFLWKNLRYKDLFTLVVWYRYQRLISKIASDYAIMSQITSSWHRYLLKKKKNMTPTLQSQNCDLAMSLNLSDLTFMYEGYTKSKLTKNPRIGVNSRCVRVSLMQQRLTAWMPVIK